MGAFNSRIDTTPNLKPSSFVASSSIDKSDEALTKQFEAVDTDGSGQIGHAEMMAAIRKVYGKGVTKEEIDDMMSAGDSNQVLSLLVWNSEPSPHHLGNESFSFSRK